MRKKIVAGLLLSVTLFFTACGEAGENLADTQAGGAAQSSGAEERAEKEEVSADKDNDANEQSEAEGVTQESTENAGYGEQDLLEYATATHKGEYMQSIYDVLTALPAEVPESSLKQKDVDCDTLQWFNATCAMFVHSTGCDYHLIAGYSDESDSNRAYVKEQLDSSWGITDRATAIETLSWLAGDGHAAAFSMQIQAMDILGVLECSEEELRTVMEPFAEAEQLSDEDTELLIGYYLQMQEVYSICGENGIDAWDYCRIMQLCGDCYFTGYFTLEESLEIQLVVARVIQQEFDSWEAMNDSYLQGYMCWSSNEYAILHRQAAYSELMSMADSPYKVLDFDMPLERFW